ncbi:hypothetical protein B0H14DRAFT_2580199 [Mycena olivaceomarginata]|nr:hypothetical protein B0H14DRAFT_2580199 [Mycena olivaceomarginata]
MHMKDSQALKHFRGPMNTVPTTVQIERLYSTLELAAKCDHTTFTDLTLHTSPDAVPMPPALIAAQAMPQDSTSTTPPSKPLHAHCRMWLLHGDSDSIKTLRPKGYSFDASVVPDEEHDQKSAKHPLMCVDVQDSFVVDPEPVAAYLLSVFPSLKGLLPITRDHASDELQGWADMLAGLQKEVHRLLRSMRSQANQ